MKPFFSIIIPVYNVAPYLRECLDSVIAQTFTDWEALCVDDGSTDGSGAILDEYAAKDRRLKVLHQKNSGVSAARNAALDIAKGEWICFLDSDDKVECQWLEDISAGARKYPQVDWIRTSYRDWFEGQEPQPFSENSVHRCQEEIVKDIPNSVWWMLSNCALLTINLFKKSKLGAKKFSFGLKYAEDLCFTLDFMVDNQTKMLLTLPNDSYCYRIRASSASRTINFTGLAQSLSFVIERWKKLPGRSGEFTRYVYRNICRCFKMGRKLTDAEAPVLRKFLLKAFFCGFFSPFRLPCARIKYRWLLFMILGHPGCLFEKATVRWLIPKFLRKGRR